MQRRTAGKSVGRPILNKFYPKTNELTELKFYDPLETGHLRDILR